MRASLRAECFAVLMACGLASVETAQGANGTWYGTQDGYWTNSANWSVSPYAGYLTNEKATFDRASGNTTLDISGLYSIGSITFDTANVAAYTIGAGALNSQTLVMGANGLYYLTVTAGHSQIFNAALQLGGSNVTGSYFIRNESATETLTFAGNVSAGSGSTAGTKTLSCYGAGSLVFSGNLSKGAASALVLTNGLAGTLTLSGSNTLQTLCLGASGATVTDVGGGFLGLSSSGGVVLNVSDDSTISGSGKIGLNATVSGNGDNVVVAGGKTLVVKPEIAGAAGSTLAKGGSGTCRLTAASSYAGAVAVNSGLLVLSGPGGALSAVSGLTVSSGGTLSLENSSATNHANRINDAAPIALNGGTLAYAHGSDAADYSETLGALTVSAAGGVVSVGQAGVGYTSAVRFASLGRSGGGTVNFSGAGLGEDSRSRIFITGQADGLIGIWATVNGTAPAAYDSVKGVYASTSVTEIAARGPDSVIPDDASTEVRITSAGVTGPITLAGDPVSHVGVLRQNTNEHAVVRTASKTFLAGALMISAGRAPLTIGEAAGDGVLSALGVGGQLALVNDSSSALTVNAALADNGTASSLEKSGTGDVVISSATAYTGATVINNGTLTFNSGACTQTLAGAISGGGALAKTGALLLHLMAANTYTGTTTVSAGVIQPNSDAAFGTGAGGLVIADGAALELGCTPDVGGTRALNGLSMQAESVSVRGAGPDGRGAIMNSSTGIQINALGKVALAGDATFSTRSRWDIRDGTFAMNDHVVTKTGADIFSLSSVEVTPGPSGTAGFDVTSGVFRMQRTTQLNGSAANTVHLRSGTAIDFYDLIASPAWSLIVEEGTAYNVDNSTNTSQNIWGGPVTLNGTVTLTSDNSAFSGGFAGLVSGAGGLVKTNDHTFYLTGTSNTYAGQTAISGGNLYFASLRNIGEACSLGQPATAENGTIRLGAGSTTVRLYYTGTGDSTDRTIDLSGTSGSVVLNQSGTGRLKLNALSASGAGNKTLFLQGSTSGVGEITCMITNGITSGTVSVNKSGTGAWVLSGGNRYTGATTVDAGTLAFSGSNVLSGNVTVNAGLLAYSGSNVLSGSTAVNGGALTYAGTNILAGSLSVNSGAVTVSGTNSYGVGDIYVGGTNRNATLTLAAGSSLSGSGGFRFGNPGGNGALYLNGGSVLRTQGAGDQNFVFGRDFAYGYLNMTGGSVTAGRFQMAGVNAPISAARGIARISGGTLAFSDYLLFARNPGCEAVLTMDGGTLNHINAGNNFCLAFMGGRAEVNLTGGSINNSGKNVTFNQNGGTGATGIVNLCSGTLTTDAFTSPNTAVAYLNFSGGTLASSLAGTAFVPTTLTGVYSFGPFGACAGGAVIDSAGKNITIPAAVRAPTGQGVASIAVASGGSGYIGEPYVSIEGGAGVGATAVANMADDGTGSNTFRVASITITCPGLNYTAVPSVLFKGGGTNVVTALAGPVTLAGNTSGGLTKSGAGVLTLSGANTYTGTTTVAGGTLKLAGANALQPNTQVTLSGGTLDLNGLAITNALNGSGVVSNGTCVAVLSPAGEGTIGTNALTLASATVRGTYLADTNSNGCDLLAIQGNIDLSKVSLSIVNVGLLDTRKVYTILTCTGSVTGTFAGTNLSNPLWHVVKMPDGTVRLVYAGGTLIRIS